MTLRALSAYVLPRRRRLAGGCVFMARGRQHYLESLSVVVIVATLVSLALDSYVPTLRKFMLIEAASLTTGYRTDVALALAETGRLPESIEGDIGSKRFSGIEWRDDEIVFELGSDLADGMRPVTAAAPEPLTLSFRVARLPSGERPVFLCGRAEPPAGFIAPPVRHTSVPDAFLPVFCRI